jgi:hypothetical protein
VTTDLPLEPGSWALDKTHTRVGFAVRHLGVSKVRGYFTKVDAALIVGSSLDDTRLTPGSTSVRSIPATTTGTSSYAASSSSTSSTTRPSRSTPRESGARARTGRWTATSQSAT